MIRTPILIVGAGPSGLMLSAQLLRYGTEHVIVDRKRGVTELSKALAVQARTLEQYRQLGIADAALEEGFIARNVRFIVDGQTKTAIELGDIGAGLSPYPYLFILEQSRNEALLADYIRHSGGDIQWGSEVTEIARDGDGFVGTLKRSDGTTEPFECTYLVGCGGASSPVRNFLGMPFRGSTNEQIFFVADVNIDMDIDKNGLLLAMNGKDFLGIFPMSGDRQYRAIGVLPERVADPSDFPFELIREYIETNVGIPAKITNHSWHAGYRVHHRIVDDFQAGNAFLVGDAAHIHSPAGGQGMNTGLGDAVNLGWKLAATVNGWSAADILSSYNEERRPFGVRLVHTTDRAFAVMVSRSRLAQYFRTRVLPVILRTVLRFGALRRQMFETISQTLITYRKSAISDGTRHGALASGDRFPWFEWDGGNSFEWLETPGFAIINCGNGSLASVPGWSGPAHVVHLDGAAADAATVAGLPANGSVIIRPDMHISRIVSN